MEGDENLIKAFEAEGWNGLGFQCQNGQTPKLYLAQPFHAVPRIRDRTFPHKSCELNDLEEAEFLVAVRGNNDLTAGDVWITDFLGRSWLTIRLDLFGRVPELFCRALAAGYKLITHTAAGSLKVELLPRDLDRFRREPRRTIELKLVERLRKEIADSIEFFPDKTRREIWEYIARLYKFSIVTKHWNWATPEGRVFCTEARRELGKNKLRSAFKDRYEWTWFQEVCERNNTLHRGGWWAYDPGVAPSTTGEESPTKRPRLEEEEECRICMDAPATTTVMPCGCSVACDDCSRKLRHTGDNAKCVRCRRPITHVFYKDNTIENKDN